MLEKDFGERWRRCWGTGRALGRKRHSWDSVLVSGGDKKALGVAVCWELLCPGASLSSASGLWSGSFWFWLWGCVTIPVGQGRSSVARPLTGCPGGFPGVEIPVLPLSLSLWRADLVPWWWAGSFFSGCVLAVWQRHCAILCFITVFRLKSNKNLFLLLFPLKGCVPSAGGSSKSCARRVLRAFFSPSKNVRFFFFPQM